MNPVFAADTAAILMGPLASDAEYRPNAGGSFPVRVIAMRPDDLADFGTSRFGTATTVFLLAVSAVAQPVEDDLIILDGQTHIVQGVPRRDANRLRWRIDTRPA